MIDKRKLILVIEVALKVIIKESCLAHDKLIRDRKFIILICRSVISHTVVYFALRNLESGHLENAEEFSAIELPCSVEGAADPSLCSSAPLVITSWSSSSERAICHTQHNNVVSLTYSSRHL